MIQTGYLYCFSNSSMPGILKIGMTERSPKIRLNEANTTDTWRPPTKYKIEFAKFVNNPIEKEKTVHLLLEKYTERVDPRREFFRTSSQEVLNLFELMDGEWYSEQNNEVNLKGCRDMRKCFKHGQRIRHTIGSTNTWTGIYDSSKNGILYYGKFLTLHAFAMSHYKSERPDRTSNVNAWKECECEVNGEWVSTFNLPEFQI